MEKLISQLVSKGVPVPQATRAINAAFDLGPVNGATELQKLGADYHHAFKVLGAPYIAAKETVAEEERALETESRSPVKWFAIGVLLFIGGWVATGASHDHAVASGAERFTFFRGLFVAGASCIFRGLYVWVKG